MKLKIYNTKSRTVEEFKPLKDKVVNLYACGMTVYDNAHIGHAKKYIGDDILIRVLKHAGYNLKHAMNVTDVGHLTSDQDTGMDKMEKGARKYGLSVWDVAKKFEAQFWDSMDAVGNNRPDILMHATDFIKEQMNLIKILEKKGYTYTIEDGVYFDTSKFPHYFDLSHQNPEELKKGARVEFVAGKKNVADFALWKFSYPKGVSFEEYKKEITSYSLTKTEITKRQMEWESPWGLGFPGWHIECSAMSLKALTNFDPSTPLRVDGNYTIDIHTGGIDHINVHHTNEIAQSEAATGKEFVRYWVHHNFLMVNDEKMSKSLGNIFTVQDVMEKGFKPMVLRYLFLTGHYRSEMNFTWESLEAAQKAYDRLLMEVYNLKGHVGSINKEFLSSFEGALYDDLNTAKAIAIIWELIKSNIDPSEKLSTLKIMDEVLGLKLFGRVKGQGESEKQEIPKEIEQLKIKREEFRKNKEFKKADEIRKEIENRGYEVIDTKSDTVIKKK